MCCGNIMIDYPQCFDNFRSIDIPMMLKRLKGTPHAKIVRLITKQHHVHEFSTRREGNDLHRYYVFELKYQTHESVIADQIGQPIPFGGYHYYTFETKELI